MDKTKSSMEERKMMMNVAGNTKYIQVWDLLDDYIGDEIAYQRLVAASIFRSDTT